MRSWTVLPDHASVNFYEEGAERVAEALSARGIGVEETLLPDGTPATSNAALVHAARSMIDSGGSRIS